MNHNVTLILNRKAIEQKDHVKYLGVLVDEHLTWKHQIDNVSKKISRGVGILSKLRNFVDKDILINIYYCLVNSHLVYGIESWGSACATFSNKLVVLQKKAIRIISGNQYFQLYGEPAGPLPATNPLFFNLHILKFHDLFKFSIAKFVYATLCDFSSKVFSDWFKYVHEVHHHATRSSSTIICDNYFDIGSEESTYQLYICGTRLVLYGDRLIKVYGSKIWNDIPYDIQDTLSIATFKEKFKNYILSKYNL